MASQAPPGHPPLLLAAGTLGVGGLGILLASRMADRFTSIRVETITAGRMGAICCTGPEGDLDIFNIHLNHLGIKERRADLERLHEFVKSPEKVHTVLGGD